MRRFLQIVLIGFALLMVGFALTRAPDANASVAYVSPYTFEQTYGAGLRLLRVDLGYKLLEKDKDNGYILFEYSSPESGNKVYRGSMELVETKEGIHVAVQIPQMPQYHERMIVDQLAKKLSDEYGEPPKKAKDKDKPKDGEKDKPKDGEKDKPKDGEDKPRDGEDKPNG